MVKVRPRKNIRIFNDKNKRYAEIGDRYYELPPRGDAKFERYIIAALLRILERDRPKKKKKTARRKAAAKKPQPHKSGEPTVSGASSSIADSIATMRNMAAIRPTMNAILPNMLAGPPGNMVPVSLPQPAEAKRPAIAAPAAAPAAGQNFVYDPSDQLIVRKADGTVHEASMAPLIEYVENINKEIKDREGEMKQLKSEVKNGQIDRDQAREERKRLQDEITQLHDAKAKYENQIIDMQEHIRQSQANLQTGAWKYIFTKNKRGRYVYSEDKQQERKDLNDALTQAGISVTNASLPELLMIAIQSNVAPEMTLGMFNKLLSSMGANQLTSWNDVQVPEIRELLAQRRNEEKRRPPPIVTDPLMEAVDQVLAEPTPRVPPDTPAPVPPTPARRRIKIAGQRPPTVPEENDAEVRAETEDKKQNMEGDGYVGSPGAVGLTTREIDNFMSRKNSYIATIPSDGIIPIILPQLKPGRKACFIVNLDPAGMPGSHWVAVMIWPKEHRLMYFDSFGRPPPDGILRDLKKLVKKAYPGQFKFKWNQIKWQDVRTDTCGYHAMKFLNDMLAGKSFPEASGFNQARRGERDVKKFKARLEKFGPL